VDDTHGSPLPTDLKLGQPPSPTPSQIEELRKAAALPAPQSLAIIKGSLTVTLQPHALALIEVEK
jgi:xylan 1,4-beta-xylosidase